MTIFAAGVGPHNLEIDDAAGFMAPIVTSTFRGPRHDVDVQGAGLIAGVLYHVRLDGAAAGDMRIPVDVIARPEVNCLMLRRSWETLGRTMTGVGFSGIRWDTASAGWIPIPHTYFIGQMLYSAEFYLRPALGAARDCNDLQTMDEIAKYYVTMLQQTETVAALLSRPNVTAETKERLALVDRTSRTFVAPFDSQVGEGELYNAQWLHPAALLVRLVTLLPESDRTPAMNVFATEYGPFIIKEHLERYFVQQHMPSLGARPRVGRIAQWELAMQGLRGRDPWDSAMSDIDLWLLSSAAEMLGAHANDPRLVPLTAQQVSMLNLAISTGVRLFQSRRTYYPDTRDFLHSRVGSASYFNGDDVGHPDLAYSGVTSEALPTPDKRAVKQDASWDIGHAYRIPLFLRALYENRKATGSRFPEFKDLQLVVNQYLYRVFNGDFTHPLFHNYFDGGDGWLRVGFNGPGYGNPPSLYCDMHDERRLCLTPGNIVGWGELAFVNPDLAKLERSLIAMAFDESPATHAFRDRYYFYNAPYHLTSIDGALVYGNDLYFVIAEDASMIAPAQ
ncbi:MAG TPA: hypothetical protein VGD64_15530 [Acidisarcina sp.]